MKLLRLSSGISILVIIAFLTTITFGPVLTSCGGGSGSGQGGGGSSGDSTFGTVQTTTSGSDGTGSILGTVSGKTISFGLENTSQQDLSGLNIEYVEATDGTSGMAIISDPNRVYETTIVMLDSDDLSASSDISVRAETVTGEHVDFFIITTATLVTIVLALLTAKAAIDVATGVYELYCDPPTLASYGGAEYLCISPAQVLTSIGLAEDTYGLLTMGTWNAATEALEEGSKTAFEIIGDEIFDEATGEVQDAVTESFVKLMTGASGKGYDSSTEYCVLWYADLEGKSERYAKAMDVTGTTCSTATDCTVAAAAGATALAANDRDRDGDGYSINQEDCNDSDPAVYPGAVEICGNGLIEDCDLSADATCNSNITITIDSPPHDESCPSEMLRNGVCSDDDTRGLFTTATITANPMPSYGYVLVNGRAHKTRIQDNGNGTGSLISGNMGILKCDANNWINQFAVLIDDGTSYAVSDIAFGCYAAATDLMVALTWDQCPNTDLDLYVKEIPTLGTTDYAWDGDQTTTANGGAVTDTFQDCYGPVYYQTTTAFTGTYQIRIHYKSGSTTPAFTLLIVTNEDFDHAEEITGTLNTANAGVSGTDYFGSTDSSWLSYTIQLTRNAYGGWAIGTAQ